MVKPTPHVERPDFDPDYRIPDDPPETPDWATVEEQLAASRNYWVGTTRANGAPHAKPVWGVWVDWALWFSSAAASVTGRNLARDPRVAVHLESGDDAVILEGRVEVLPAGGVIPRAIGEEYARKYAMEESLDEPGSAWYRLEPSVAFTWREQDFQETAARWRWGA